MMHEMIPSHWAPLQLQKLCVPSFMSCVNGLVSLTRLSFMSVWSFLVHSRRVRHRQVVNDTGSLKWTTLQPRVIAWSRSTQLQKVSDHPRDPQELVLLPLLESHQSFGRLFGVLREGEDASHPLLGFHVSRFLEESHERVLVDVLEDVRHRSLAMRCVKLVAVDRRADPARFWVHVGRHFAAFVLFSCAGDANSTGSEPLWWLWKEWGVYTDGSLFIERPLRSRLRRWHHPRCLPAGETPSAAISPTCH